MNIPLSVSLKVEGPDKIKLPPTRDILDAASAGVRAALDRHFLSRQREPRKDGFPMQGFWYAANGNSVRERMRPTVFLDDRAEIVIDSAPLAHKLALDPPPIRPGRGKKYLTLPAVAAAVGHRARDFDLKMAWVYPSGDKPSKRDLATRRKSKNYHGLYPALVDKTSGTTVFFLARSVKTPHDPRAMPPVADLERAASSAVSSLLSAIFP